MWSLDIGGAERAVFQLAREQRRRGEQADILVGSHAGFYGDRARECGINVHELHQRGALDMTVRRAAAAMLRRYDVLHLHSAEPTLALFAGKTSTRAYYTHRSGAFSYPVRQAARYFLLGQVVRRYFAGVSGNTHQGRDAVCSLFGLQPDFVPVTPNGLDFELLRPRREAAAVREELALPDDVGVVGTSAILREWKRVDLLLKAIAELGDVPVRCLIIGDGPDRTRLEALSTQLGVADRVTFAGKKEHIGDYLQVMDVFCLPSGPQESFGNSLVEAMGVGLPAVILADGGGLREHVRDGETGIIASNVGALSAALLQLLRDAKGRQQLGETARLAIRSKYSLDAMTSAYDQLYATTELARRSSWPPSASPAKD